jgi:RecA/RadA recombinase
MKDLTKLKTMMTEKRKPKKAIQNTDYLSTGSTMLDLACSGTVLGGFVKGKYFTIVGDTASGKTFLSLTCLAEAAKNTHFDDYRFIYDNSEGGVLMEIEQFFGSKVAERIEAPRYDENNEPLNSVTIEEFYFNVDDAIKDGRPFIYILDSMDSLSSEDEMAKFDENKDAYRKGRAMIGSYGDGKAKKNSANLRRLLNPLEKSGSILIVISQTRDNLGFGFEKKTKSGGKALDFYACVSMWSNIKENIQKTVKGKKRQLGIICQIKLKKNRLTGRLRQVEIPIYHSIGIDNIGSCIDYLIDENHWSKKGANIAAPEFEFKGTRDKLIKHIEDNNLENDLHAIVGDVWDEIEEACVVPRKKKYE